MCTHKKSNQSKMNTEESKNQEHQSPIFKQMEAELTEIKLTLDETKEDLKQAKSAIIETSLTNLEQDSKENEIIQTLTTALMKSDARNSKLSESISQSQYNYTKMMEILQERLDVEKNYCRTLVDKINRLEKEKDALKSENGSLQSAVDIFQTDMEKMTSTLTTYTKYQEQCEDDKMIILQLKDVNKSLKEEIDELHQLIRNTGEYNAKTIAKAETQLQMFEELQKEVGDLKFQLRSAENDTIRAEDLLRDKRLVITQLEMTLANERERSGIIRQACLDARKEQFIAYAGETGDALIDRLRDTMVTEFGIVRQRDETLSNYYKERNEVIVHDTVSRSIKPLISHVNFLRWSLILAIVIFIGAIGTCRVYIEEAAEKAIHKCVNL